MPVGFLLTRRVLCGATGVDDERPRRAREQRSERIAVEQRRDAGQASPRVAHGRGAAEGGRDTAGAAVSAVSAAAGAAAVKR